MQGDHRGMSRGIVLQVAVGGDDQPAARVGEAGGKRRRLAEVAAEPDDAQPRIARLERRQLLERVVRAAVVHDQDLVGCGPTGPARLRQLLIERARCWATRCGRG